MESHIEKLKERLYDFNAIRSGLSIFGWDQQTYMPAQGGIPRAEHVSRLARMLHEMFVADETKRLLDEAAQEVEPGSVDEALVRVVRRDFDLSTKIPSSLVTEKSSLSTKAHEVWVESRATKDFGRFAPVLEQMVDIVRREAEYLGYEDHPYDALLDQYEEGMKTEDVRHVFEAIRQPLVDLVRQIKESGKNESADFLHGNWQESAQRAFTEDLIQTIGFDLTRGRQDVAPHPFCGGWSIYDVRLTTRFQEFLASSIFGSLHEAGHGLYEQCFPPEWDRLPLASGASLGVHESQSRLWENLVGRSREFWEFFMPELYQHFPELSDVSVERFHRAVNRVEPSFIRVEADEVTYNLHILIRFELECALVEGKLAPADLPDAWNAKYEEYLGITPPNDGVGCLQDVHWSGGMIGYFPTYTLGNLISYQLWKKMSSDLGSPLEQVREGKFDGILGWLRENVHQHGARYKPNELVEKVTGKPIGPDDYLEGIRAKVKALYDV